MVNGVVVKSIKMEDKSQGGVKRWKYVKRNRYMVQGDVRHALPSLTSEAISSNPLFCRLFSSLSSPRTSGSSSDSGSVPVHLDIALTGVHRRGPDSKRRNGRFRKVAVT